MNNKLEERLNSLNITIEEINEKIHADFNNTDIYSILIYSSNMEGLGNKYSDFDLYVLFKESSIMPQTVKEITIKGITLDIEYIPTDVVLSLNNRLKDKYEKIEIGEIKLLHRIRVSEIIFNENYIKEIKQSIPERAIAKNLIDAFVRYNVTDKDDFFKFYKSGDYESSLPLARNIVQNSVAILNVKHGYMNVKTKWITRIFLRNNGYNEEFLEKYERLYLYPNINREELKNHLVDLIDFSNELMSEDLFN